MTLHEGTQNLDLEHSLLLGVNLSTDISNTAVDHYKVEHAVYAVPQKDSDEPVIVLAREGRIMEYLETDGHIENLPPGKVEAFARHNTGNDIFGVEVFDKDSPEDLIGDIAGLAIEQSLQLRAAFEEPTVEVHFNADVEPSEDVISGRVLEFAPGALVRIVDESQTYEPQLAAAA